MKIAVTGAHGFLGSHVVDAARAAGHEVSALVSPWGDPWRLAHHAEDPAVVVVRADVSDPEQLRGTLEGTGAVVHAAARVRDYGPWRTFYRVNVGGTVNVCTEAQRAGTPRVVLLSSIAVWRYLGVRGDDPRTRPRDQNVLPYGRSKRLAEDATTALAREPVLVRPALWPYGRRDANLTRIVRGLRTGMLPLVDGGRARLQTVDAVYLARVIIACCTVPVAAGRSYLVADEGTLSWREAFAELATVANLPPPRRSLPGALLEAVAPAVEAGWPALRLPGEPPLTRYRAGLMRRDMVFDASAVPRELGLRPPRSRRTALADALGLDAPEAGA